MSDSHEQVTVTLSRGEWNLVRVGLMELPAKIAMPVLLKFEPQLQPQPERGGNGELRNQSEPRHAVAEPGTSRHRSQRPGADA